MKVRELIESITKQSDLDDEIIVAWWTEEASPCSIKEIPWSVQCEIIEENMDWSGAHEDLGMCVEYNIDDFNNDKDTEQRTDK